MNLLLKKCLGFSNKNPQIIFFPLGVLEKQRLGQRVNLHLLLSVLKMVPSLQLFLQFQFQVQQELQVQLGLQVQLELQVQRGLQVQLGLQNQGLQHHPEEYLNRDLKPG